jgi:uncharacterized repeat protein (TIGR01451 family)
MSTRGKSGRLKGRRNVLGAAAVVGLVVVSLLTAGAALGRPASHHSSASSSTHLLSHALRNSLRVSGSARHAGSSSALFNASILGGANPLAPVPSCGAANTIANASGFEDADGNLAVDTTGCMDWNQFTPTWSGAPSTTPPQTGTATNNGFNFAGATDLVNSTSDSIYAGGVKQDTVCPGTVTGKANDKADLAAMYVATERINGQVYLFLSWERQIDTTVNSDVFVSFEFNQSNVSCGSGSPFVQRTVGDLLFDYNFQSGNSTIDAEEWDGTTWQPLTTPPFEASVNQGTVLDTIRPDQPVSLTQFEFGEAGINLSGLSLGGEGGKACETFGSVLGGSRTSKSGDTAQLKDFVGPAPFNASNCVQPTATTTLKNAAGNATIPDGASIPYGSSVYDTTTLGNLISGIPTGHVQYTFFTNGTCSGPGTSAGLVALNADGTVPNSSTQGPLGAGSYSFNAQYLSGNDPHYSDSDVSACEPFTVLKTSPSISTLLSNLGPVAIGTSVHDSSTLTGASADAAGTAEYAWYSSLTACNAGTFATPGGTSLGTKTVAGGVVPDSDPTGPINTAGTYYFRVFYSGDANNNGTSSTCSSETLVVSPNTPSVSTLLSESSGNVGDTVHDTATLSGATANAGGTITYKVYSDNECTNQVADLTPDNNNVVNGVVPNSKDHTFNSAGTFYFQATYSGDNNNTGPVSSECTSEQLVISAAHIQIVKTPDAAQVNAGEPIGFTLTVYNTGAGDANGVKLTDTLPVKAGLNWSIAAQGSDWGGTCSIDTNTGVLTCGGANGVTVPGNTTQAASKFTVHITSPTTAATGGVCPEGSGVINNTGDVSTSNDGSGESSASTCVAAPAIHIVKTADAAQVNVGSPIGFTLTVSNAGSGDAHGVKLSDTLPTNAGLSWSIASQGAGWGGSCSIAAGVLSCGGANGVTVPKGTTQTASTFTVHITSPTTGATGGDCPNTGVVNNTGTVTTSNDGTDQSSASTCVQALVDLSITKSGSPATQELGAGNITWTMVVTNNGPSTATGVKVSDPMPAGNTFVSATSTQGTCTGGATLNCDIGTMAAGASVTITLVTTPSAEGTQTNTAVVSGDRPETNVANNTATATVEITGAPFVPCTAISKITPGQLIVGRKTLVTIHLKGGTVKGVKVRIKGAGINVKTAGANGSGVIKHTLKMKKRGIITFTPITSKSCGDRRVGVRGVFTPPVTG